MSKKTRTRSFLLLLYKESSDEIQTIQRIFNTLDASDCCTYVAILHDKDVDKESEEEKKEHYHVLLTFPNARSVDSVASSLDIDSRFVQACHDKKESQLYLVHSGYFNKHRYEVTELFGTDVDSAIYNILSSERAVKKPFPDVGLEDAYSLVTSWIDSFLLGNEGYISKRMFMDYACSIGCFSQALRLYNVFSDIIYEHNNHIDRVLHKDLTKLRYSQFAEEESFLRSIK